MYSAGGKILRFEGYTLDLGRGSVRGKDGKIELRPKGFELLRHLAENAGRLISKDEIAKVIWPNVIVTDDSITRCISDVRLALGDSDQRIIKTVPRRGYLFAAAVSQVAVGPRPTTTARDAEPHAAGNESTGKLSAAASFRQGWRLWALAASALLLVSVGGIWFSLYRANGPAVPDRPSIAVLPFANLSGDPQQDYFGDGISEDLITQVSKFPGFFVIARQSVSKYKGTHLDERQIGRELGVRYLLEGSVRRDAERLRITAQLVDARTRTPLWAQTYDRELTGIFAVQDEVTQMIAATLAGYVSRAELERVQRKPPENFDAYDYYLRGRSAFLKVAIAGQGNGELNAEARQLFSQASAADPSYASAIVGAAQTYSRAYLLPINGEYLQRPVLDQALALARRAVELDPYLPEAHAELGWILHWQYRRTEALAEFERGLKLNPNYAEGRFGLMLIHVGRRAEGIEFMKRVMRLDPFHRPILLHDLGSAYYLMGQYGDALGMLKVAVERIPMSLNARVWSAAAAAQLGRREEARLMTGEALRLDPRFTVTRYLDFLRLEPDDANLLADGLRKAGLPE